MRTTTGTDLKAKPLAGAVLAALAGLIGGLALASTRRANARRAWSFVVYYVGYRVLSVQVSCQSVAVSSFPLVLKYAT
ncbi:MAG: hypothetical protein JO236_16550 [Mycobacterium sp.]|uniref:hypothetical protein n=1 Tax=Mycobacterium sp. TaxID=1785 RepID=UPI001EBE387E|nr:hypothetical protein [Mycobacterium sp.]MBW0019138.1 hypothetical protein [Mycobacterium sp.]